MLSDVDRFELGLLARIWSDSEIFRRFCRTRRECLSRARSCRRLDCSSDEADAWSDLSSLYVSVVEWVEMGDERRPWWHFALSFYCWSWSLSVFDRAYECVGSQMTTQQRVVYQRVLRLGGRWSEMEKCIRLCLIKDNIGEDNINHALLLCGRVWAQEALVVGYRTVLETFSQARNIVSLISTEEHPPNRLALVYHEYSKACCLVNRLGEAGHYSRRAAELAKECLIKDGG